MYIITGFQSSSLYKYNISNFFPVWNSQHNNLLREYEIQVSDSTNVIYVEYYSYPFLKVTNSLLAPDGLALLFNYFTRVLLPFRFLPAKWGGQYLISCYMAVGDGQGSLACCSPWGHKESDTTEWLNWTEHGNGFPWVRTDTKDLHFSFLSPSSQTLCASELLRVLVTDVYFLVPTTRVSVLGGYDSGVLYRTLRILS